MRYATQVAREWARAFARTALAVVYIEEAHAVDEWRIDSAYHAPLEAPVRIPKATDLPMRLAAARDFVRDFALGGTAVAVYADAIDNPFQVCVCGEGWGRSQRVEH